VISTRYANMALARRHLEQLVNAVLLTSRQTPAFCTRRGLGASG
jgi:phosphoenolpyruvate carboxylase